MFDARTRLFFACLKGAAGAALKRWLRIRFSAPTNKNIGSGSGATLKVAAPGGSANTACWAGHASYWLFASHAERTSQWRARPLAIVVL